ncbi:hypothetical protein PRZ48_005671 [Zasmidium cellare]|uniref:Uncharacterized protein n=1 Tax=Zasmidium cellare TaxID=395010 RepID=A0ABR0EL08_ZASCE|nr:hypothetical protein PRZ48_005671 [Zasmidium cellare]
MARFGVPNQADDTSPNSTPLITSSSTFSLNSIRSTPCPGRGLYPQGPLTLPANDSMPDADDVFGPGTVIQDSVGPPTFRLERAQEQQRSRLRESLATLREALVSSTALVNSLRMRNEVFRAENTANQAQLKQFREGRDRVKGLVDSEVAERKKLRRFVGLVVAIAVVLAVGYGYWCWCMGPEMQCDGLGGDEAFLGLVVMQMVKVVVSRDGDV